MKKRPAGWIRRGAVQNVMPDTIAPGKFWDQLRSKLRAKAARSAQGLEIDDIVSDTVLKTVVREQAGAIENVEALAFSILSCEIADAMRAKSRELGAWSTQEAPNLFQDHDDTLAEPKSWMGKVLDGAPRAPGGRPTAEKLKTIHELEAALKASLRREFLEVWGVAPAVALANIGEEMLALDAKDRRAWLAQTLDHELGDRCPWAVDSTFRTRGAKRRGPARGVGDVPQPDRDHAVRLLEIWRKIRNVPDALDRAMRQIAELSRTIGEPQARAQFLASLMAEANWPTEAVVSPIGDEFLTDREMAIISLLLGNFPASIRERADAIGGFRKPFGWGVALTAEIEAMQAARERHGVLRTAEDKLAAGVGPKKRRKNNG